jgi:hypothetical protein
MNRIGTAIAVVSLLTVGAMTDYVFAQSAPPAQGSFKGTYSTPGGADAGASSGPTTTSSQGTDSQEPSKPTTRATGSFDNTYSTNRDGGTKPTKK